MKIYKALEHNGTTSHVKVEPAFHAYATLPFTIIVTVSKWPPFTGMKVWDDTDRSWIPIRRVI